MPDPDHAHTQILPRAHILLLGAGRMGSALLKGWLSQGASQSQSQSQSQFRGGRTYSVIEPHPGPDLTALQASGDVTLNPEPDTLLSATAAGTGPDIAVIAVKPQVFREVTDHWRPVLEATPCVLSIAAGTTLETIQQAAGSGSAVIRAMPNTPAAIGRGVTVCVAGSGVSTDMRTLATVLLEAGGPVFWTPREEDMDAVTAVSGSGPAYIFHMAEALAEAGMAEGLDPALARDLARLTVAGAGALLWPDGADPGALREAVTSPGGTTQAGLSVLMGEDAPLKSLMRETVKAAAQRGRDLGKSS